MADKARIEDDGRFTVEVGEHSATFDLYDVYDRLVLSHNEHRAAAPDVYFGAIKAVMEDVGLPPGSNRLAAKFQKAVWDRVDELKKNDTASAPPPGSPASTGPQL